MLTCTNNVRFDSPEGWEVTYADVRAVRNFEICELLFTGRLEDCYNFVYNNRHEHTSTPTCPFMQFRSKTTLNLPHPHGALSSSSATNHEYEWGTPVLVSGNAPTIRVVTHQDPATICATAPTIGPVARQRKNKTKSV